MHINILKSQKTLGKKKKISVTQPHFSPNTFLKDHWNFKTKAEKHNMDWTLDLKGQQTFSTKC